jgi:hypothetical protein
LNIFECPAGAVAFPVKGNREEYNVLSKIKRAGTPYADSAGRKGTPK